MFCLIHPFCDDFQIDYIILIFVLYIFYYFQMAKQTTNQLIFLGCQATKILMARAVATDEPQICILMHIGKHVEDATSKCREPPVTRSDVGITIIDIIIVNDVHI